MLRFTLLFIVVFVEHSARAQGDFEHLTTADGLSQSTVWAITQDKKGFIWLATADGLNRYDGYSFKVFRHQPNQAGSLSTNDIATLHADRRNNLWVAPRKGGLNRLRADGETFAQYASTNGGESIGQISITCFAEDEDNLWIGTSEDGLFCHSFVSGTVSRWEDVRFGKSITALYQEADQLWIGTGDGKLFSLHTQSNRVTAYELPVALKADPRYRSVTVVKKDGQGRFWVGTGGRGLFQFDPAQRQFTQVFFKPGKIETVNMITDIVEDPSGRVWVLTDYGAVVYPKHDARRPALLMPDAENEKSLSTHALKKAFRDAEGNLWMGTWQGGVNILRAQPELFTSIRYEPRNPQSLLTPKVTAVASDRTGGLWIGSTRGLTVVSPNRKQFRHIQQQNSGLGSDDIPAVLPTPAGNVLISTWTTGFSLYNTQTGRLTAMPAVGKSKSVSKFAIARLGGVWIGTQEELLHFNEQTNQLRPVDLTAVRKVYNQVNFNALCEDASGQLWIGTYNGGLIRWNRKTAQVWRYVSDGKPGSLSSNSITCLFEDRQGRIWIGTNGGGLNRFNARTGRFTCLTTQNGLPNNFIADINQDDEGTIWLSTNGVISNVNPATNVTQTFYQSDGLMGKEFIPGASTRLPSGELAFGHMQGLVLFRPERLKEKSLPPPVNLTALRLFNRPVNPAEPDAPSRVNLIDAGQLVFKPNQSVFTLEYTGISYLHRRNIRYAYKLEDFDPDWNYVGTQRSATYTNLPDGTYTFLVKAAVGNGDWSTPRAIQITVLPPWYRTWWTYLLYGLTFLSLLYAIRRIILIRERLKADIRIKQIERDTIQALDDAKTSFFTNISHEFRTPLTLILTPLDTLKEDVALDPKLRHQVQIMQRNAQRMLRLVNQLLDLSKLESGSLIPEISRNDVVYFIERIVQSFGQLAESKRNTLLFKANYDSYEGFFDADVVEKIVYNLLSNALRFTPEGGEVCVSAVITPAAGNQLILTVEDTGVGISEADLGHIFERFYQAQGQQISKKKAGSGIGLALTRELTELHRGTIRAQSTEKVGTQVVVTLPLDESAFPPEWLSAQSVSGAELGQPLLPLIVPEALAVPAGKALPLLLIVEDNEELRQYLKESFSQHYHVLTAADGKAALVQAQKLIPDLVISDWLMPEMDGAELCQALKTNEKTSHIPFLLLTSRSSNPSQLSAFALGIDDYVTKPFNLSILEAKVKALIQNRQVLREKFSRRALTQPSDVQLPPKEAQFIQKIVAVIETHLDDPHFDIEQLEDALNLSRMQLYRKLKSITNLSGTEFIRQVRLQRAVQLLEHGSLNVSEIAYQVGFSDPAYFSRCFKKEFGKTPMDYLAR
ncbi:MAG: response regulator [Cytophagaceae bacterium]|nr:response regulator [Cytophagaceae bacterium]